MVQLVLKKSSSKIGDNLLPKNNFWAYKFLQYGIIRACIGFQMPFNFLFKKSNLLKNALAQHFSFKQEKNTLQFLLLRTFSPIKNVCLC
jgi:hypothetical protein